MVRRTIRTAQWIFQNYFALLWWTRKLATYSILSIFSASTEIVDSALNATKNALWGWMGGIPYSFQGRHTSHVFVASPINGCIQEGMSESHWTRAGQQIGFMYRKFLFQRDPIVIVCQSGGPNWRKTSSKVRTIWRPLDLAVCVL